LTLVQLQAIESGIPLKQSTCCSKSASKIPREPVLRVLLAMAKNYESSSNANLHALSVNTWPPDIRLC